LETEVIRVHLNNKYNDNDLVKKVYISHNSKGIVIYDLMISIELLTSNIQVELK